MSGKVIITTPFPTPDEIAAFHKIPAERVAELRRMIDDIRALEAAKSDRKKNGLRNGSRKLSSRGKATRSRK